MIELTGAFSRIQTWRMPSWRDQMYLAAGVKMEVWVSVTWGDDSDTDRASVNSFSKLVHGSVGCMPAISSGLVDTGTGFSRS